MRTSDEQARESASLTEIYSRLSAEQRALQAGMRKGFMICLLAAVAGVAAGLACCALGWTL